MSKHAGRARIGTIAIFCAAALAVLAVMCSPLTHGLKRALAQSPIIPTGNVMVSIAGGQVEEFTPAGSPVQTLTTGDGGFTTGSVFDSSGNFYVNDFTANAVTEFDPTGALIGDVASGSSLFRNQSILFDTAGNAYVGNNGYDPTLGYTQPVLTEFIPGFATFSTFQPTTENAGTDWDDLEADQCTMLYTSQGADVLSFDVCADGQNLNFASGLPGPVAYALRIIPPGSALPAGYVLVADSTEVTVLDSSGNVYRDDTTVGT